MSQYASRTTPPPTQNPLDSRRLTGQGKCRGVLHALLVCGCLIGVWGCTGKKTSSEPQTNTQSAGTAEATNNSNATPPEKAPANVQNSQSSGKSDKSSQKYVDGIPYDVFFDQPLSVAAENQGGAPAVVSTPEVAMSTPQETSTPAEPAPSASDSAPPTANASADWNKIITRELLQDEVNRLRNSLTNNLNSVGNFNRELLAIQADAAVLAALAGVAAQHDADFTWKEKAKFIRDMAAVVAESAETRGRPAFEAAEKPFLNILEILNGGTPAELPDSDDETVFSDVAERNLLMKQVKINADFLSANISKESEMKDKKEEVIAKATVLAVIGKVVMHEDYVFADEEEYQQYCQMLIEGSLKMAESASDGNFDGFKTGLDLMNKSCNDCHPKYLNE